METVKNSPKQLHLICCSGPRSRLSRLIIDIVVSFDNESAAQSGLKCIIQMLQKKNDKIKNRTANVMKKQVLLSVRCQVQGKEKQKI